MTVDAISIVLLFVLAAAIAGGIVIISAFLGGGKKTPEKLLPYECGLDPVGSPRRPFSVKFFLIAILFIIFDVEIAFLYPWAVVFREIDTQDSAVAAFAAAAIFLGVIILGLIYAWGKGALEWED